MTATIGRDGAFALKVFPRHRSDAIESVVALTHKLRFLGVPIPETSSDFHAHGIRLPWIDGPTMKQCIELRGPCRTLHDLSSNASDLVTAMKILCGLHSAGIPQRDLTNFDPFRHIDQRLGRSTPPDQSPVFYVQAMELRAILKTELPEPAGKCIIHGDFHVGQLIQDGASGKWWLIDLDDVARGYPEADVANFCVHLATSKTIFEGDILAAYRAILAIAVKAYGRPLENHLLAAFAATTFLRRALKKAERGEANMWTAMLIATGRKLVS